MRSWWAAAAAVLSLATLPVTIVTVQDPAPARADVCGSVGGRHVSAGGCADVADAVAPWVPPPTAYAPLPDDPPPPEDIPPPPPPPPPPVTGCASVSGRHVSVGGCG
ncbi:MAG TPA: hypothetical protein VMU34_08435 [Mycobacterium sp.]|nr:hypothetical protein [Mycobacterium sp.]